MVGCTCTRSLSLVTPGHSLRDPSVSFDLATHIQAELHCAEGTSGSWNGTCVAICCPQRMLINWHVIPRVPVARALQVKYLIS